MPLCVHAVSSGHDDINKFLMSLKLDIEINARKIIAPYELDTYVKEYSFVIEYRSSGAGCVVDPA